MLEAFSVSHGKASAYLPVVDLLHTYFDIKPEDDARKRREKVAGKITVLDRSLEDTLPYLFALLGIVEGMDPLGQMDGQVKKSRTLEGIKRILLRESLNQPLIVMFEDLHWIDEQTQEFLNLLADSLANAKLLLLVNYRPAEYSHQWGSKTYYTQLRLDPLGTESAHEMLSALLGEAPEVAPLKKLIIERTEGNPFFMEEMYQAMLEDGVIARNGAIKLVKPLPSARLPTTVQALLAARIDRLPADAKELLQTLSVIGREFRISLVRAVELKSEDELNRTLNDLQLREFIYEQPALGDTEFIFKHALTLEVAYNSLLQERRKLMHERIGVAVEALYANRIEDHLASLAHHYARSANPAKALEYCRRACQQSSGRASYAEAVGYFETGLARLRELPEDDRRAELELDLRNAAHLAVTTTKGIGSAESEQFTLRAFELSRTSVSWEKSWMALYGLCLTALIRANISRASELATQMLAIAEQHGNNELTAQSFSSLALSQMLAGKFESADKSFDRAISTYETMPKATTGLGSLRNINEVAGYGFSAWNTWFLGFQTRAAEKMDDALTEARGLDSKAVHELLHYGATVFFSLLRERERTREYADALVILATELGNPARRAIGELYLGWFDSVAGDRPEGIERMQRALADFKASGSLTMASSFSSLIAQVQCLFGRYDEALVAIDEALAVIEQTGNRAFEAEVHRIKGELQLAKDGSNTVPAEQSFRTAIEVARAQKARSWELRATTSLARLLDRQGRRDEARAMLADIYNWFAEGFDTADLKDAKALSDELNR